MYLFQLQDSSSCLLKFVVPVANTSCTACSDGDGTTTECVVAPSAVRAVWRSAGAVCVRRSALRVPARASRKESRTCANCAQDCAGCCNHRWQCVGDWQCGRWHRDGANKKVAQRRQRAAALALPQRGVGRALAGPGERGKQKVWAPADPSCCGPAAPFNRGARPCPTICAFRSVVSRQRHCPGWRGADVASKRQCCFRTARLLLRVVWDARGRWQVDTLES